MHRFVPSPNGSRLTLLLLHGTGGDENDLLHLGRELSPAAALLSPRGKVLENGMPRFFRRLSEGLFDFADLTEQTHALAGFVEGASKAYHFPVEGVVAVGYSNGANIAGSTLMLHPTALAGAVLIRPMVPLVPERPPELSGRPILVLSAERDSLVPREETVRLVGLLRSAGAEVQLHWAAGTHAMAGEDVTVARQWLAVKFAA